PSTGGARGARHPRPAGGPPPPGGQVRPPGPATPQPARDVPPRARGRARQLAGGRGRPSSQGAAPRRVAAWPAERLRGRAGPGGRSEERRVGKEGRGRWWPARAVKKGGGGRDVGR